jgi:hypothetical protein
LFKSLNSFSVCFNFLNNTIKNHSANVAKAETAVNKEKAALNNLERSMT